MKKISICIMLCMLFFCPVRAQELSHDNLDHVSAPFYDFADRINGKNFYFENNWVKAKILTANNSIINNDSLLYNFDKVEKRLLVTRDYKNIFEVDWREFKAVKFYTRDTSFVLEHIYLISNKDLFQTIINGDSRYSLYKTIHTKIVKGIYSSGSGSFSKAFDHYQDIVEYCIFFPDREYRSIKQLKRSSIEKIFKMKADSRNVSDYLNTVGKDQYDEEDLKKLIAYLNSQSS